MVAAPNVAALELHDIHKRFGTVNVLSGVGLSLEAGRVHALAGENGAGKSTLVKIIGGVHRPDSGRIVVNGQDVHLLGPLDSQKRGVAVVHQHPALFPDLTVAENVFIGRQPRRLGGIDWRQMIERSRDLLARLSVDIDVLSPVKLLGVAERQAIEIARALAIDARVLVLDEPTSALSSREVTRLFDVVGRLKADGVAILFVTHFIDEILDFSDDTTVLRSGRHVVTAPTRDFTAETIVSAMIGTKLESFYPKQEATIGDPVLSVHGLSGADLVEDVSFEVRSGEILGFFGLVGAGRSEVANMLFGMIEPDAGTITMAGETIAPRSAREAVAHGISLVPEDRHKQGLVLQFPIRANETMPILRKLSGRFGFIDRGREHQIASQYAERMRVVSSGIEQVTGTLSGRNQQKVLLAKWLMPSPKLLILDEPTRGIDVGAKSEIHRVISQLATEGLSIIMISDDAGELIGMADRILVFRNGRIATELARPGFDRQRMLLAAAHAPQATARAGMAERKA